MVNEEALKQIEILEKEYEKIWGKKVDYTIIPKGIAQESLVEVLKIMIANNDSMLVAFNKYKEAKRKVNKNV